MMDFDKLINSLTSPNPDERREAIRLLGQQGPASRKALPYLREALTDQNYIIRLEAAVAIGFIGTKDEIPHLLPLLDDVVNAVRFQTISALAFLQDASITPELVTRFDNEDPNVQDQILRAVGQLGGPQAFDLLEHGLSHENSTVRCGAVVGFGFLRDLRARALLQNAAENDPDEIVAHEARIALHQLQDNTGLDSKK